MIIVAVICVSLAIIVVASLHHARVMDARCRGDRIPSGEKVLTSEQIIEVKLLARQLYEAHPGATDAVKQKCFVKACNMKGIEPW